MLTKNLLKGKVILGIQVAHAGHHTHWLRHAQAIDLITRVVSEGTPVIDLMTRVVCEGTAVIDLITRVVLGRTAVIDLIT
jgi:hypothetical protein